MGNTERSGIGFKALLLYFFGFIFIYGFSKTNIKEEKTIYLLAIISIAFSNFFVNFSAVSRLGLYLTPFLCLAFACAFKSIVKERDKIFVGISFYIMCFILYYRQSFNDVYNIFNF